MFLWVSASVAGQSTTNQIYLLAQNHCSESLRSSYSKSLTSILKRLPSRFYAKSAMQVTIPVACKNNFNSWLVGLAFNLNLFALDKKATSQSLKNITPFLAIRTFGKKEYLQLSQSWQKFAETSYSIEKLNDFFGTAVKKNYRALPILGAGLLYFQFLLDGKEHNQAKEKALSHFYEYRQIQDIAFVEKKALEILKKEYKKEYKKDFVVENILQNMKTKIKAEAQKKLQEAERAKKELEESKNKKNNKRNNKKRKSFKNTKGKRPLKKKK